MKHRQGIPFGLIAACARGARRIWLGLPLGLLALPAAAHEFWLEPLAFAIEAEQPIGVDIRIGQHFKGDSFPFRPSQVDALRLHRGETVVPVSPQLGDLPAIGAPNAGEGLNILTLASSLFPVTYYEAEKFPEFARHEGQAWAIEAHRERGLPATGFTEAYRRHAKTLVAVGKGRGADRRTGLEFEWVLLTNPYTDRGPLTAQLWWRDAPMADAQARLFTRHGGEIEEQVLRTDADGRVTLPRQDGTIYLLNAVHLMTPEPATLVAEPQAVWESRWASLTFATP